MQKMCPRGCQRGAVQRGACALRRRTTQCSATYRIVYKATKRPVSHAVSSWFSRCATRSLAPRQDDALTVWSASKLTITRCCWSLRSDSVAETGAAAGAGPDAAAVASAGAGASCATSDALAGCCCCCCSSLRCCAGTSSVRLAAAASNETERLGASCRPRAGACGSCGAAPCCQLSPPLPWPPDDASVPPERDCKGARQACQGVALRCKRGRGAPPRTAALAAAARPPPRLRMRLLRAQPAKRLAWSETAAPPAVARRCERRARSERR